MPAHRRSRTGGKRGPSAGQSCLCDTKSGICYLGRYAGRGAGAGDLPRDRRSLHAICVEELVQCGAKVLIRIGTCGGMALSVQGGDLVVASSAIRMEGVSKEYLPVEFPAAADFGVTAALVRAGEQAGVPCHVGVVQCKDSFYGQHDPDSMPAAAELKAKWTAWMRGGCLASEMESAALFIVSAARGVRAGLYFTGGMESGKGRPAAPYPLHLSSGGGSNGGKGSGRADPPGTGKGINGKKEAEGIAFGFLCAYRNFFISSILTCSVCSSLLATSRTRSSCP